MVHGGHGGGCFTSPNQSPTLGLPPTWRLWAQLCFLLGDAGAEGTTFAHPVSLQGPGGQGDITVTSFASLDPQLMLTPTSPAKQLCCHFLPTLTVS